MRRFDLGVPQGRQYHVAYRAGDNLDVVDIWDSMEAFTAFGERLMPVLASHGVDPGAPEIIPAHSTITG